MTVKMPVLENWINPSTNISELVQKNMHELIVNNVERFRLTINNQLIYGKCKINFDFNFGYKDSNGITHNLFSNLTKWNFPKFVFAYYNDGFYSYNSSNNKYKRYSENSLLNQIFFDDRTDKQSDTWYDQDGNSNIQFLGWFLSPSKESRKRISSIEDIYKIGLFNFKEDNKLSEITLYAHWNIPEYTVTLYNITRNSDAGYSCFNYKGQKYVGKDHPESFKIIYNTDMKKYLEDNVADISYRTFGYTALDGTNYQQSLRNNPQSFLGWSLSSVFADRLGNLPINSYYSTVTIQSLYKKSENDRYRINLYPQFTPIVILKYGELPDGAYYRSYTTPEHPNGKYYVRGVGGHYYVLFTGTLTNSHLYELFHFRNYTSELISYLRDNNSNDADNYYYIHYSNRYYYDNGYPAVEKEDEYGWRLIEKDNSIGHIDINTKGITPLSSTFIYTIVKTKTRRYL